MRAWLKRRVGEILGRLPPWQAVDPLFYACASMAAASLVLGGGARSGHLRDAILTLLAVPLFAAVIWRLFDTDITRQMRWALWFCLALAGLPLLQVVPLPGWVWTHLPHREISAESFALIQQDVPWMPMSVSPEATWLSALSLLPPLSLFVGILLLGYRERRWLSVVIIAIGLIGVFLGLLQVAQGPASSLRLFRFANPTEAVGFFANRNHFAALVYVLVLLVAAWTVNVGAGAGAAFSRKQFDTESTVMAIGCFTLLVVLLAAQAMARSRAGMGLTMVALGGAFSLVIGARPTTGDQSATRRLLMGAIAVALVLTAQFALYRILERFDVDPVQDFRLRFLPTTIQAAQAYMPTGSGLGSFIPVYHLFERPQDVIPNIYITRAHNDVLESWLETGVFGLALMGWFVVWFTRRSLEIWRGGVPLQAETIDWSLARSATIILPLLAVHCFFDYPLRTNAMMAVVAFACALLIEPPASALVARTRVTQADARLRISPRMTVKPVPVLVTSSVATAPKGLAAIAPPSTKPMERWGSDVEWPEEWRDATKPEAPGGSEP